MLEQEVEDEIVKWAKELGGVALKLKLDNLRGWPDRTILLPGAVIIFVEVKRPSGGKIYSQQAAWMLRLGDLGFRCIIARSLDEVRELYARI